MKKLLYVSLLGKHKSIEGFSNIEPNELNDVVNHSVYHIYCDCLEFLSSNDSSVVLDTMIKKIRPDGILTILISNTKHICRNYYMNAMDDSTFLKLNHGHNSVFSTQSITQLLQKSGEMKVIKLENSVNQLETIITSQRIKI